MQAISAKKKNTLSADVLSELEALDEAEIEGNTGERNDGEDEDEDETVSRSGSGRK